ncbi:MAG: hypothetical protein QXU32_13270 [Nitrososphaerales archaeon]
MLTTKIRKQSILTISAIAVATIALIAYGQVNNFGYAQKELITPTGEQFTPLPGRDPGPYYIWVDEAGMTGKKKGVMDFLQMPKGSSSTAFVEIQPLVKTELPIELFTTIDKGSQPPKMPPGVNVAIEKSQVTLQPNKDVRIPVHITTLPEAPDGTYTFKIYGKWSDGFKGTIFHLVVGQMTAISELSAPTGLSVQRHNYDVGPAHFP